MGEVSISVIVPTHSHGDLIAFPLRCLLAQTVQNFEILVIGDGITEEGRRCVQEFASLDSRVRFFDYPKGERYGEAYRHKILTEEARGQTICYACDDDLLLPGYLESMTAALREHDFAHPTAIFVNTENVVGIAEGHLGLDVVRRRLIAEDNYSYNFIALNGAAHTMEFYRSLPFGWRTTPVGIPTDLYMWKQMLSAPNCRAVTWPRATMAHFPDSSRREWTMAQRRAELSRWEGRLINSNGEVVLSSCAIEHFTWRIAAQCD